MNALFRDNSLISGDLKLRGKHVELSTPLNLLHGATDHITPPDQVFALAEHASTPPELVRHDVTACGHLGLFMGHEALREHGPRFDEQGAGTLAATRRELLPRGPALVHRDRDASESPPMRTGDERHDLRYLVRLDHLLYRVRGENDSLQHVVLGEFVRAPHRRSAARPSGCARTRNTRRWR